MPEEQQQKRVIARTPSKNFVEGKVSAIHLDEIGGRQDQTTEACLTRSGHLVGNLKFLLSQTDRILNLSSFNNRKKTQKKPESQGSGSWASFTLLSNSASFANSSCSLFSSNSRFF